MEESIRSFSSQFNFEPKIENEKNLRPAKNFAVGGMGGSNLATEILQKVYPNLDISVHRNYGLPDKKQKEETLFIASSFSGNTEETLDFLSSALKEKLNVVVIAKGGKLISLAEEEKLPFIKLPDSQIQPRMALGWSLLALVKFIKPEIISQIQKLSSLNPSNFEERGKDLAEILKGRIPVIYCSENNAAVARIWKIKLNETGKIPAFFNVLPELNHNEMTGFDYNEQSQPLSEKFFFIILKDSENHLRIQKRISITAKMLEEKDLPVKILELEGDDQLEKIFNSLFLADWISLYTARAYGAEPEQVPMVENLKKQLTSDN